DSGMLTPKKSLLAVFGVTRHVERVRKLTDLVPCENCSFANCQYRRAPYARAPQFARTEPVSSSADGEPVVDVTLYPLDRKARYSTNVRALSRWASDRLTLTHNDDDTIDALFRYDGTTCSNMGRSFTFHYTIKLGPREDGYPIVAMQCT